VTDCISQFQFIPFFSWSLFFSLDPFFLPVRVHPPLSVRLRTSCQFERRREPLRYMHNVHAEIPVGK